MALGRYGRIGIALFATAFGLLSLAVARKDPVWSFAGRSTFEGLAELGAGWALVAAGLLFWTRQRRNGFGPLLAAAGIAWFLPEWTNPGVGTAIGFTLGTVGLVACVPLVVHAALAGPPGRLRSRIDLAIVVVSYFGALLLLGALPATAFDPRATGCNECPRNLLLIRGDADLAETFTRFGLRVGIAWLAAAAGLLLWRLVRSPRATAVTMAPVVVPAIAYVALVALDFQHSLGRGFLSNEPFDRRVWRYEAAALLAFALAVGWSLVRERRARASVARLIVELGGTPRPGAVRDVLAATLGDPTLDLLYRRPESDAYMNPSGHAVDADVGPRRAVTPLLRGDRPIALLVHDPRLLERPGLVEGVLAGGRIAVENERLQAEVLAQLEDLRASRARIVETGDSERRRLERDLHDGAQQRLLALSYDLRLARAAAEAAGDAELATLLANAGAEAQVALGELRELAHGIYPAILAEAGIGPALESLADSASLPVELAELPVERYSSPVETAVYVTVAEAVSEANERQATFVAAEVARRGAQLVITVRDDGDARRSALVDLADRIGALGGSLEAGTTTLQAAIPCA